MLEHSEAGNVRICLGQEFEKLACVEELNETFTDDQTEWRPGVSQGGPVGWSIGSKAGPGGWSAGSQAGPGRMVNKVSSWTWGTRNRVSGGNW